MKTVLRAVLLIFCITLCLCLTPAALAEGETGVIIPNGTTIIEDEAFAGCANITSVTIPASVARIGAGAFAGCNGLKEVHFNGSASQWDAVYVNSNNAPLRNSMICFQNGQCRIPLDERYFSDAVFRGYVAGSFDSDGDGWLNEGEVVNVKHILCPDMGISSLKGVELFAELRTLNCPGNNLSELDISHNTKLKDLCCGVSYSDGTMYGEPHGNHLASLDVSNNPDLETLYCAYNNLTSLNLRSNTKLKELLCYSNQISSLDVSRNTALTRLLPGDNPLGSLNVRANTNLEQLNCYDNGLTNLDLSQNRNLVFLWCNDNRLTSLNLSDYMKLDILRCDNNNLTSLNLSGCSALRQVFSSRNSITKLNLSGCTALEILECQQNSLSSLDVSNCTNLRYLMLWRSGSYTSLDLSRNSALVRVNLSANNNLSNLTLGSMQNLEMLWVQNTNLRSLNISGCPTVLAAYIQGTKTDFGRYGAQIDNGDWYGYQLGEGLNPGSSDPVSLCQFCVDKRVNFETHGQNDIQINSTYFPDDAFRSYVAENFDSDVDGWLDAEEISAVKEIRCYRMGISSLKGVEFFKELTFLDCVINNLTALDVRSNTKLQSLGIFGNSIASLDLSNNTALTELYCGYEMQDQNGTWRVYGNQLTELDLSHNSELAFLVCPANNLSTLNVSNHTKLRHLQCWSNQLTSLNVSGCTALEFLSCSNNSSLTGINLTGCASLVALICQQSALRSLNLGNCTQLQNLQLWQNNLTSMNLSQNTALIRVNLSANNNLSSLTIGRMQNLEQLWVQNTSLSTVNIRNCPIIAEAYRSGNKHYFSWGVGYGLDGFNLGGGREVDLCNFCLGSSVSVTA